MGENQLFKNPDVDAQVRMVPCEPDSQATCINAFAIELNQETVVTIHGGYTTEENSGNVWIDGEEYKPGFDMQITSTCWLTREAHDHYKLYIPGEWFVNVHVRGRYLDVRVEVSRTSCQSMQGLLGACNSYQLDDFVTSDGDTLKVAKNATAILNQYNIHKVFGHSWKVTSNSTLFVYGFGQYKEIEDIENSVATYCLLFDHSSAESGELNTFSDSDVTIEFDLKLAPGETECGTILSYTLRETFSVAYCDTHFSLQYGTQAYSTSFGISKDIWYRVALVWQKSTKLMQIYCFDPSGKFETQIVNFGTPDVLSPGGKLVFGSWYPPPGYSGQPPQGGFIGQLDEIKIWKSLSQLSDLKERIGTAASTDDSQLASYWKLNEGQGSTFFDAVSSGDFTMQMKPWNAPQWIFSSATVRSEQNVKDLYALPSSEDSAWKKAEEACEDFIMAPSFSECNRMGLAKYFQLMCSLDYVLSKNSDAVMEVVLAYADQCNHTVVGASYPAKPFCNYFPTRKFPQWIGANCDTPCISGYPVTTPDLNVTCKCYSGYWGEECTAQCKGGAGYPCGDNGVCLESGGACECPVYYTTQSDCNNCEEGWHGVDCTTVSSEQSAVGQSAVASFFSYGHFLMFDGMAYNMEVQGEFTFSTTSDMSVYIRQVPCGVDVVCITNLWIRLSPTSRRRKRAVLTGLDLSFRVPFEPGTDHLVFIAGEVLIYDQPVRFSTGHTLTKTSPTSYIISKEGASEVTISIQDRYINLQLVVPQDLCRNAEGTFAGSCDNNTDNDFQIGEDSFVPLSNITYDIINGPFAAFCTIPISQLTQFVYEYGGYKENRKIQPSGNALFFNGTACISEPFVNIFETASDITIEFILRGEDPTVQGGTLVSYLSERSFAITNDNSLKVHYADVIFDTGIVTETQEWGFVSFMYYHTTGLCTLYYINHAGGLNSSSFEISSHIFKTGGTLALGRWQPGRNASMERPPLTEFVGYLDELRIWARTFDILTVWQSSALNVQPDAPDLAALWKMSAGHGNIVEDLIHQNNLYILEVGGPVWSLAGAPLDPAPSSSGYDFVGKVYNKFSGDKDRLAAEKQCGELFLESQVALECQDLGPSLGAYFYQACLMDYVVDKGLSSAAASVEAFSSYCKVTLNLSSSPFDNLCKNISNSIKFVELECEKKECVFGTVDAKSGGCTCDKAHWGDTCSLLCPGGLASPCNLHGVCVQETGLCSCETTWSEASNCTECRSGWTRTGCLTSETDSEPNATVPICNMFGQGHFVNYDGLQFDFKEFGEFYVTQARSKDFAIQVRILPCYDQSSCVTAFAIRYNGETVVVRTDFTKDSRVLLWHNEQRISYNNLSVSMEHFVLEHTSSLDYSLKSGGNLRIRFRVIERSLSLLMLIPSTHCDQSEGICGSCDANSNNDVTDIDHIKDNNLWVVQPSDSLFIPLFGKGGHYEERDPTGAEFCLHLDGSYLSSDVLNDVFTEATDATIEFLIKAQENEGIILSYSTISSFTIYIHLGTIRVAIGGEKFDTALTLEANSWNQVSVVWKRALHRIEVYLVDSHGSILQAAYTFSTSIDLFIPGGRLVIGGWQPGTGNTSPPPVSKSLLCSFDELRIWHRAQTVFDIQFYEGVNIQPGHQHIFGLWKFNEGQGVVVYDLIHHAHFHFTTEAWIQHLPTWRFSYAKVKLLVPLYTYTFIDVEFQLHVRSTCAEVIQSSSITSKCKALDASNFEYYLVSCIRDYGLSESQYAALSASLAIADFCSVRLAIPKESWPARWLCNYFQGIPFPIWSGQSCDSQCFFPSNTNSTSGQCLCSAGYWGTSCNSICPGGFLSKCGNHGSCLQESGLCRCESNWKGDSECKTCSAGWKGEGCFLPVIEKPAVTVIHRCSVFSSGFYTLFDGASVVFTDIGDYTLYDSGDLTLQVRQTPCQNKKACITAVALMVEDAILVINALSAVTIEPLILLNNQTITLGLNASFGQSDQFRLERVELGRFDITGPDHFHLILHMSDIYMNIDFDIHQTACAGVLGLCGPCVSTEAPCTANNNDPFCALRHLGLATYETRFTLTYSLTYQFYAVYQLQTSTSLLYETFHGRVFPGYPVVSYPSPAGFGLFFDNSGIVSTPIPIKILNTDHITVQFYVQCTGTAAGTIISFTHQATFAVTISGGKFHLHYGDLVINTEIFVVVDEWLQISLVYDKTTGRIDFYCVDTARVVQYRYFIIGTGVFTPGCTMGIGTWQLPTDGSSLAPGGTFVGYVDTICFWGRPFSPTDVINSWGTPGVRFDSTVVALWPLDFGIGSVGYDVISSINLLFPVDYSISPTWWSSSAPVAHISTGIDFTTIVTFSTPELQDEAERLCTKLIYSGPITDACGTLTTSAQYYYIACLADISSTSQPLKCKDSVLAFATECQMVLKLDDWPAQLLCNDFPDEAFPVWAGPNCTEQCVFGTFTTTCVCLYGYWGAKCDKICPGGGPQDPCHGNGICNVEAGTCKCFGNWKGDAECGTCSPGWTGADCSLLVSHLPPGSTEVSCSMRSQEVTNFAGVSFDVPDVGVYQLTKLGNVELQVMYFFR